MIVSHNSSKDIATILMTVKKQQKQAKTKKLSRNVREESVEIIKVSAPLNVSLKTVKTKSFGIILKETKITKNYPKIIKLNENMALKSKKPIVRR